MSTKRYAIVNTNSLLPTECPCGVAKRAFTDDPAQIASLHVVQVSETAKTHYHKKMTEIYYILEGEGQIELDSTLFDICLLYTSPSPRDKRQSRMPSSA